MISQLPEVPSIAAMKTKYKDNHWGKNIGSRKSIINNGGIKENEVMEDGEILERYWITI